MADIYLKGPTGQVIGFDAGRVDEYIQAQWAAGTLRECTPEGKVLGLESLEGRRKANEAQTEYGPVAPGRNASKSQLVEYAVAVGFTDRADAEAMTRAELVSELVDKGARASGE